MPYCSIEEAWGSPFNNKENKNIDETLNNNMDINYSNFNVKQKSALKNKKRTRKKSYSRTMNRLPEHSGPNNRYSKGDNYKQLVFSDKNNNNKILEDSSNPNYQNTDTPINSYNKQMHQKLYSTTGLSNININANKYQDHDNNNQSELESESENHSNLKSNRRSNKMYRNKLQESSLDESVDEYEDESDDEFEDEFDNESEDTLMDESLDTSDEESIVVNNSRRLNQNRQTKRQYLKKNRFKNKKNSPTFKKRKYHLESYTDVKDNRNQKSKENMFDIMVYIITGIFLIFILDSFVRLGKLSVNN